MSTKEMSSNKEEQLMNYLRQRTRVLECENKELKKEVTKMAKEKDVNLIEYYLRLRRDLLEEIENLKISSNATVINHTSQNDKMQNEIMFLNTQLLDFTNREKTLATLASTKKTNEQTIQSCEREYISLGTAECLPTQMTIASKVQIQQQSGKTAEKIQIIENEQKNSHDKETEEIANMFTVSSAMPLTNINDSHIKELEDKNAFLENSLRQSEFKIKDLNASIEEINQSFASYKKSTQYEIDSWKQKYNSILTSSETLSNEYKKVYEDSNKNFKNVAEKTQYELGKKVMHLERLYQKKESDLELSVIIHNEAITKKEKDIEQMKGQIKNLIGNYEAMHMSYEAYLVQLTKSLDSLKQLYLSREKEFVNITNYYMDAMHDYAKPLNDSDTIKNQIEKKFNDQIKDIETLYARVEEGNSKLNALENETLDYKPKMRMKLTQSIKGYEESLATIHKNHHELFGRFDKLEDFLSKVEEKVLLFNSILEDNKTLTEKNNALDCQMKMNDPDIKNNQILMLKEQLFKVEKDNEVKSHTLKEYEDMFKQYDESAASNKNIMYDEVVMKLRAEISRLNSQLLNLNKTKDGIEKFYQTELKNMMTKISKLNEHNDELKNIIRKMENDFMGKKETILNLWMLEFKEFKENLINLQDIKILVEKFQIQGDELSKHKEYICNEELYMMRQEIKVKDDSIDKLRLIHDKENKRNIEQINLYKSTIESKIKVYETMNANKLLELTAVQNEKEKLKELGVNKQNITDKELLLWKEQKGIIEKLTQDHHNFKAGEIGVLKTQIMTLQNELATLRKTFDGNLKNVIKSVDEQMYLIKDREAFTVKQLEGVEEQFAAYKDEKERFYQLVRKENEQLKQHNNLLKK